MLKNRKLLGILLTIIMVLAFSVGGFAAYYTYTQESGTNFYAGTDDKADALEDTNELRQIIDDFGNLLGHSKRDDSYPADGTTGGTLKTTDDLENVTNYMDSPGIVAGGEITEGTTGTFTVAAITAAYLRASASATAALMPVTLAIQSNQAITAADTTYYVIFTYGTPCTVTTNATAPNGYNAISLGKVMKDTSNNVHYVSGGFRLGDGVAKLWKRAKALRAIELMSGNAIAYSGTNNFTMTEGKVYAGGNCITQVAYNSADTAFIPVYTGFIEGNLLSGTDIAFVDGGAGEDTITRTAADFVTNGYVVGDTLTVAGSTSNDGSYAITGVVAGTLNVATGSLTAEGAAATVTLTVAKKKIDFARYDNAGTLTAVANNKYGCHWVYCHVDDGDVYVRYGVGSYTLADAETAEEPAKPTHLTDFGCLIGKIIAPKAGGSFTAVQMVTDTFFVGTNTSNHNYLGGLQGGTNAEYYHLTSAQHTIATQVADTTVSGYLLTADWDTFNDKIDKSVGTAEGDLIYFTGSAVPTVLAKGTATQVLAMNAGATAPEWVAAAGGYSNLTEFVDQTAWRVFYSNTAGDVVELEFGADGTYLKSNGAAAAPTFSVPAGSGNVSKVGTPADSQIGVWTGDGTIEGAASLTYDGANLGLTGDIGITGTRITKGWFTDLEVTNAIAGSVTGNAATVTSFTPASGSLTLSGADALTLTTTAATDVTLPTTGTLMANLEEDTDPDLGGQLQSGAHSINFTEQVLTSGAAIAWNLGNSNKATLTAAHNFTITITAPSGALNAQLIITQDGTGTRVIDEIVTQSDAAIATTDVNATTEIITVTVDIPTGARIRFKTTAADLPAPLVVDTIYYAIRNSATEIKVATTKALAHAGTAVDLTDQGTGTHTVQQLVKWPNGTLGVLSTAVGSEDVIGLTYKTVDKQWYAMLSKDFQ